MRVNGRLVWAVVGAVALSSCSRLTSDIEAAKAAVRFDSVAPETALFSEVRETSSMVCGLTNVEVKAESEPDGKTRTGPVPFVFDRKTKKLAYGYDPTDCDWVSSFQACHDPAESDDGRRCDAAVSAQLAEHAVKATGDRQRDKEALAKARTEYIDRVMQEANAAADEANAAAEEANAVFQESLRAAGAR